MKLQGQVIASEVNAVNKLDKRDRDIINILSINSRTPVARIASFLKTSTESVNYRLNRLQRNNVITDVFPTIDQNLLGIHQYTVHFQFKAISEAKMKELIAEFLQKDNVTWVMETGGKWELLVMFATIHQEKYSNILQSILLPTKEFLNDFMVSVVRKFSHTNFRYIGLEHRESYYKNRIRFPYNKEFVKQNAKSPKLDKIDVMILKCLNDNSRVSLTDIAKKVNLTRDAVNYRVKNLVKNGVIKSFIARLNYHLLGYQYTTILLKLKSVSEKRKSEFLAYLHEDERLCALMELIGTWDLSLMMFFSHAKDIRECLIKMKEKFSDIIQSHDLVVYFDQYYYTYLCKGVLDELFEAAK